MHPSPEPCVFPQHSLPAAEPGRRRGYAAGTVSDVERVLVSACLLGRPVRYDGRGKPVHAEIWRRWQSEGRLVPYCPEVGGGLPVPRPPAEITGTGGGEGVLNGTARVVTDTGEDVTDAFLRGAHQALETALRHNARVAVLKDSSPSCATTQIYDGTFTGHRSPGTGVTTALLERHDIRVFPETALDSAAAYLTTLEHP